MTQILKNQLITHNNKSEINNTFFFSHEYCMSISMSIAWNEYRPLNFCLLMQHTRPCYVLVAHEEAFPLESQALTSSHLDATLLKLHFGVGALL